MPCICFNPETMTITKGLDGTPQPATAEDVIRCLSIIDHYVRDKARLREQYTQARISEADRILLHGLGVRWDDDVVELRIPSAEAKTTKARRSMKKRPSTRQRRKTARSAVRR